MAFSSLLSRNGFMDLASPTVRDHTRSRLHVELVRPSGLQGSQIDFWKQIIDDHPRLERPQLQPEFAIALERVGRPIEVAVIHTSERPLGFFAFARVARTVAEPIGGITSDQEALIVPDGAQLNFPQLLRCCGLTQWTYSHLDSQQATATANSAYYDDCYVADLEQGFPAYLATVRQRHDSWTDNLQRKARKLSREHGGVTFEWHSGNADSMLELLCQWKRQQLQVKGFSDMFREPWVAALFHECLRQASADFEVLVSTLRAGERVLAVHLGLRSGKMLLSWIPTYNPDYAKYSPGVQLLVKVAEAAAARGVHRLDLGRGENQTKQQLATSTFPVAIGRVSTAPFSSHLYNSLHRWKRKLRTWGVVRSMRKIMR